VDLPDLSEIRYKVAKFENGTWTTCVEDLSREESFNYISSMDYENECYAQLPNDFALEKLPTEEVNSATMSQALGGVEYD
jgi:hypothetical protein